MKGYLIAIVFFAVFLLAMVTIRQQTEALRVGYRIGVLQDRLEELRDRNDRLRLTVERLRAPDKVMENALRLKMKPPRAESRPDRTVEGSSARLDDRRLSGGR
jgi:cell division protein FtsL